MYIFHRGSQSYPECCRS